MGERVEMEQREGRKGGEQSEGSKGRGAKGGEAGRFNIKSVSFHIGHSLTIVWNIVVKDYNALLSRISSSYFCLEN